MQEEGPKDSQQEPQEDSALQTPQPDQPHPPVSDDHTEDSPPIEPSKPDDQAEDSPPLEGGDTKEEGEN